MTYFLLRIDQNRESEKQGVFKIILFIMHDKSFTMFSLVHSCYTSIRSEICDIVPSPELTYTDYQLRIHHGYHCQENMLKRK